MFAHKKRTSDRVVQGVILTHGNIVAAVAGMVPLIGGIRSADVLYCFMPLSHAFQLTCVEAMLACGASVGFYSDIEHNFVSDIAALHPSIVSGVPYVYDRLYRRIMQQVYTSNFAKRWIFNQGLSSKSKAFDRGSDSRVWNQLVFNNVKKRLGGCVRLLLSSTFPLS